MKSVILNRIREHVAGTHNETEGPDLRWHGFYYAGHLQWLPGQTESLDSNPVPGVDLCDLLRGSANAHLCRRCHIS